MENYFKIIGDLGDNVSPLHYMNALAAASTSYMHLAIPFQAIPAPRPEAKVVFATSRQKKAFAQVHMPESYMVLKKALAQHISESIEDGKFTAYVNNAATKDLKMLAMVNWMLAMAIVTQPFADSTHESIRVGLAPSTGLLSSRGDADNYLKMILDAFKDVEVNGTPFFHDDGKFAASGASKVRTDGIPMVFIELFGYTPERSQLKEKREDFSQIIEGIAQQITVGKLNNESDESDESPRDDN